jgi:hypothetical protein
LVGYIMKVTFSPLEAKPPEKINEENNYVSNQADLEAMFL